MSKYATEFIGTFFLMATIGFTLINMGAGVVPPLAIGSVLMAMVYAGGHASGAHYNPAVTTAVFLRGAMPFGDVVPYLVAQFVAAILAALTVCYVDGVGAAPLQAHVPSLLAVEFLFTFGLAWVVLNVATAKNNTGNSFFGIAIGFTVLAGAFAVGDISGGAFNPAVAVGAMVLGLLPWSHLWAYVLAEIAAGAAAAIVFKTLHPHDR